jgi:GNAT superfamily N-acetyltransferase
VRATTTKYILGIDSGAVKNNLLCQMQADILGIPVIRPKNHEATIYGAMLLAGLSTGIYSSLDELSGMWSVERVFEPQLSKDEADGPTPAGWPRVSSPRVGRRSCRSRWSSTSHYGERVQIVRRSLDHPDAAALCAAVQAEYVIMYGGADSSPMAAAHFEPPEGSFLVGYLDDAPVGSAAWRRLTPEKAVSALVTAEIKRVYVDPGRRRQGIARLLMLALERDAHAAGIERLVLETGPMQPEAIRLYRALGYTDTDGGGWSEYAGHPNVVILQYLLPRD